MKEVLKRYGVAFAILAVVVFMMILGTFGVMMFEKKMFEKVDVEVKPKGENIIQ